MKFPLHAALLLLALLSGNAAANVLYVDLNSPASAAPYADWTTAATNIQDAIDAASPGDQILVSNGVYQVGGRAVYGSVGTGFSTNRVVVDKAITVQSVNGPQVTSIEGYQVPGSITGGSAIRCIYLTTNAVLSGFTLTNGATRGSFNGQNSLDKLRLASGGGAWCEDLSVLISNCVFVSNAADFANGGMGGGVLYGTLNNCVLQGNRANLGGGAFGSILNDCALSNNMVLGSGGGNPVSTSGGGSYNCAVTNCIFRRNTSTVYGAGAARGTLFNCEIADNSSAYQGGGTYQATVINCSLHGNTARDAGGGSYSSSLNNCTLSTNTATFGGGSYLGTLTQCRLIANFALCNGGGAWSATLRNCALVDNSTLTNGGGAFGGNLFNCTVTGNSAESGGGIAFANATNCIVIFNTAQTGSNHQASLLSYCCTLPMPTNGIANIAVAPELATPYRLTASSPCRGAGDASASSGTDVDGDVWANPPAIGCDEYDSLSLTGLLSVAIQSDYANARTQAVVNFAALIDGRAAASSWNFGDGTVVSNQPYESHVWTSVGTYPVVLTAFNGSYPGGISGTNTFYVMDQPTQYVALASTNPAPPYLSWETAATNIQDAIDVAFAGGTVIRVNDGVYQAGGRAITGVLTNRVAISRPMIVQSVNGAASTVIQGYKVPGSVNGDSAVRCAYLVDGARLDGFTLIGGATRGGFISGSQVELSGGGVWCYSTNAVVSNCMILSNSCNWQGAGAFSGTLRGCVISSNLNLNGSLGGGGGAAYSTLLDCSVIGNRTGPAGGGAALICVLSNCLVQGNYNAGAGGCTLFDCVITGNDGVGVIAGVANNCIISSNISRSSGSTPTYGGGASRATLNYCLIYGNQATNGAGAETCTLNYCRVFDNVAVLNGGGVYASILNYCVVSNNSAAYGAGAVGASKLTNCVVTGNRASINGGGALDSTLAYSIVSSNRAAKGGGTHGATLIHCLVIGNTADIGGGAYASIMYNSTVSQNFATNNSGGVFPTSSAAVMQNCIVYYNSAPAFSNYFEGLWLNSCSIPRPFGTGNISNAPVFIDLAGKNFRLQTNSPCINTGNNAYVADSIDLDGRPRIVGGTVDMGAYEFQGPGFGSFIPWLQQFGLATNGTADYTDSDLDGLNNWQEWIAGTTPTEIQSVLKLFAPSNTMSGLNVSWQSVSNRTYFLQRASNIDPQPAYATLQSNVVGQAGKTTFTDNSATNGGPYFYRVGVQQAP